MKSKLVISLLLTILGAVMSVWGDSEVKTVSWDYSCCETPEITFDPKYETSWNINGKAIAINQSGTKRCVDPCTEIGPGRMVLDRCVDVNATMVLTNGHSVNEEEISASFHGRLCSGSGWNQMAAGIQGLLLPLITGLTVNMMIC